MFRLGYNTNGLAHHRPLDALRLVAELGYEGLALTPDVGQLDPARLDATEVADLRKWSDELGVSIAIETGARFVLDARRKHRPNLMTAEAVGRQRRVDFYRRCLDLGAELGAQVLSLWAGDVEGGAVLQDAALQDDADPLLERLAEGLRPVLAHAREVEVTVAFEPEPGMFVERPSGYLRLLEVLGDDGDELGLTLDVGHLLVTGDLPVPDQIRELAPRLVHVHLDDIAGGVHEHRMFGQGELDLVGTLAALSEVGFDGMAAVELSRDSHRGAAAAEEAMQHLRRAIVGQK
ncbi:MAG: sugar phosphate isomerase/epimerase [Planctomycetota bacterium]|nr:sugar phosphate isomerase/epimerase [Planctomycetota bacterium]